MERTRIKLDIYVDLDPVPGTFHTAESARNQIDIIMRNAVPHYNPTVSIGSYDTAKEHGEPKNNVVVIKKHDTSSWNAGPGVFCAVAKNTGAAMQWVQDEVDGKHESGDIYAKGKTAEWWVAHGAFTLTEVSLEGVGF